MFLFWWVIFLIARIIFLFFFQDKLSEVPIAESLATFTHGFPLDLSAICYVLILPILMLLVQQFTGHTFYKWFLLVYTIVVVTLNSFITVFDLAIYADWGTKLSYRAIHYLQYAGEGAAFTKFSDDVILFLIMLAQVTAGIFLYRKMFRAATFRFPWKGVAAIAGVVFFALVFPLLFLGIRGGWQLIPINESSAYFSAHQVANDAAVNTLWNAGKKLSKENNSLSKNPYQFSGKDSAKKLVDALYKPKKDSTISVLTTNRPNVVLFILESFTADVVEALGGEKGVTPNLDSLIQHGILFTNIYAQGFRTDQGLAAVLSGFPAQPNFSIIMQPEKFQKLNFLSKALANAGYHNSFFYGGETGFANMKAYLIDGGIDKITDKSTFTKDQMNAKWGAHDGFVFQTQAQKTGNESSPFFSVILSLSSHEPFEVPMKTKFPGDDDPSKFKNACAYTDQSIGAYFQSIKNTTWYQNTLFIFVADHGHILPRNRNPREAARFHVPVIFYGDVIKQEYRGVKIPNLGMQTDIPATLLAQLQLPHGQFEWSNDLLNPFRNNFAYYTSDDAFGWITASGSMIYDFKTNAVVNTALTDAEINSGKAFLQTLFEEYVAF